MTLLQEIQENEEHWNVLSWQYQVPQEIWSILKWWKKSEGGSWKINKKLESWRGYCSCFRCLITHIFPSINFHATYWSTIYHIHIWNGWIFFICNLSSLICAIYSCWWPRLCSWIIRWLDWLRSWPWKRTTRKYQQHRNDNKWWSHNNEERK
jgi:hypothetical protein